MNTILINININALEKNDQILKPKILSSQKLNEDEHGDSVSATAPVVRQKTSPKSKKTVSPSHWSHGLSHRSVRKCAVGQRFLELHAVLRGLKGHCDQWVNETGCHGGGKHVGVSASHKASVVLVHLLVLIEASNLQWANEHATLHERQAASPKRKWAFLF